MKLSAGHRAKAPLAEKVFKKANPEWEVLQPWTSQLKPQYNPAEWMLSGKFQAKGPLGNIKEVSVSVYRDGIRIF